jgi:protein-disulfide isomerase
MLVRARTSFSNALQLRKEPMRSFLNALGICCLTGIVAFAQSSTPPKPTLTTRPSVQTNLPSDATVDSFLHQQFGYQPDLTWKISSIKPSTIPGLAEVIVVLANQQGQQVTRFYVSSEGDRAIVGDIIPFGAKPFDPAKKILEKGVTGPSRGPKDAPVMIVEFGDLQCPACKAAQPTIEAFVAAEPNARFVFQNFPLDIHNWAAKGAAYADCVGRASNDAFWKFLPKTYEEQPNITAENADQKLTEIADQSGVKGSDIAACAAKTDTKARVDASIELGKSVEVTGTPTLFINGRRVGNFDKQLLDVYKKLVEFSAKQD